MMEHTKLLYLTLLLNVANIILKCNAVSNCGPKFSATSCSCGIEFYEGEQQYVANCTNTRLTNTHLLEYLPQQVEVLIFTGNYLNELPWNVFGTFNTYEKLKIVDMSNNQIREIRGKTYHRVKHVERLILNHNNISIARNKSDVNYHHSRVFSNFLNLQSLHLTNAFEDNASAQLSEDLHDIFINSQLTKLQKLHLEQNEIIYFKDRRVFCDLPSLRDLHLGDNLLKNINFEVRCLRNLRFLDLERNKFEFVNPYDLRALDELESQPARTTNLIVDFNLNPFNCDCNISALQAWMRSTNVTVRKTHSLMCYQHKEDPLPIVELNLQSKCGATNTSFYPAALMHDDINSTSTMSGHTATLIFLLIVLSMILIGLLVALAYISRDKLKFVITPVFDNVVKKVQYTSIKDEDCPEVHV